MADQTRSATLLEPINQSNKAHEADNDLEAVTGISSSSLDHVFSPFFSISFPLLSLEQNNRVLLFALTSLLSTCLCLLAKGYTEWTLLQHNSTSRDMLAPSSLYDFGWAGHIR